MSSEVLLVLCTFASLEEARQVCRTLLEERLVACANMLPAVESLYRWEGEIKRATESMAILKTTSAGYAELELRLRTLHSYEVPEIIALPVTSGLDAYLAWVKNAVGAAGVTGGAASLS